MIVPVIETARLILREPREADLDAVAGFMASARSALVGGPVDRQGAWRALLAGVGHWTLRGFGYWTVEDRASGAVAGRVGIVHHAVDWPEPELGWHIYDGFEGRGLAAEAALAARGWWRAQGHGAPVSYIAPQNARSIALARRLGAVREAGDLVMFGHPVEAWRHPEKEPAA